jgi:hypothetical protein
MAYYIQMLGPNQASRSQSLGVGIIFVDVALHPFFQMREGDAHQVPFAEYIHQLTHSLISVVQVFERVNCDRTSFVGITVWR